MIRRKEIKVGKPLVFDRGSQLLIIGRITFHKEATWDHLILKLLQNIHQTLPVFHLFPLVDRTLLQNFQ